ncbi:hypothetical protein VMCG_06163 [Cytospora schulzeri]|uniref:Nudix hydrolase domain-containing protein n=1 Tax=Cytospora schulzeri TaxID=448051 RepID=A0A423W981_9PEZI|nr:hypothetical protein VMCG_06163 [Valsa malicola]
MKHNRLDRKHKDLTHPSHRRSLMETTGFTDTQLTVRDAVSAVCSQFPNTYWRAKDQKEEDPKEFHAALARGGWLGIALPEALGGSGLGIAEATMVMQTIAESGAGMAGAQSVHANVYATQPLARFGNRAQLEDTLPHIVSGRWRACFGVTEPGAGLDTLRLATRAERQGDGSYRVTGQKVWITCAQVARKMILLARTRPLDAVGKRSEGLSLFCIDLDRERPGLDIRRIKKMGGRAVDANEVYFDNYAIPAESLIGEEGRGFQMILYGMNAERCLLAGEALGLGYAALGRASEYARERSVFQRPIGMNQGIAHPLADAFMKLEGAKLATYHAARLFDSSRDDISLRHDQIGVACNSAKYMAAEAAFTACERAVLTHGGMGYAVEYDVERWFRECLVPRIAPVSREMILNYIRFDLKSHSSIPFLFQSKMNGTTEHLSNGHAREPEHGDTVVTAAIPPTEAEVQEIVQSIRDATAPAPTSPPTITSSTEFDEGAYWDLSSMAPLNASSKAAIARLRAYKPPPFPLWDTLPVSRRAAVLILLYADRKGDLRVVLTMRAASLRSFSDEVARREAWEEIGLPIDDTKIPKPFRIEHLCYLPHSLAKTELAVRPCVALLHSADDADADADAPTSAPSPTVDESLIPRLDAKEVAAVFSGPLHNFLLAEDEVLPEEEDKKLLPKGQWYEGRWAEFHNSPWRIHYFHVPVIHQRVTKPKVREGGLAALAEQVGDEEDDEEEVEVGRYLVWGMTGRMLVDTARVAYGREPEFEHNAHFGDEALIERLAGAGRLGEKKRPAAVEAAREEVNKAKEGSKM